MEEEENEEETGGDAAPSVAASLMALVALTDGIVDGQGR